MNSHNILVFFFFVLELCLFNNFCFGQAEDKAEVDRIQSIYKQMDTSELKITRLSGDDFCDDNLKSTVGDVLVVHYNGTIDPSSPTGEHNGMFDQNLEEEGDRPFAFVVGQGAVIAGWDIGLIGKCAKEKLQLIIPASLAYRDQTKQRSGPNTVGIPGGATLRFEVTIVDIKVNHDKPFDKNLFVIIDNDPKDGFITKHELTDWFKWRRKRKELPEGLFEKQDVNNDEKISLEEFNGPKDELVFRRELTEEEMMTDEERERGLETKRTFFASMNEEEREKLRKNLGKSGNLDDKQKADMLQLMEDTPYDPDAGSAMKALKNATDGGGDMSSMFNNMNMPGMGSMAGFADMSSEELEAQMAAMQDQISKLGDQDMADFGDMKGFGDLKQLTKLKELNKIVDLPEDQQREKLKDLDMFKEEEIEEIIKTSKEEREKKEKKGAEGTEKEEEECEETNDDKGKELNSEEGGAEEPQTHQEL